MDEQLNNLYHKHCHLWREQERIEIKLIQITRNREDIAMEYSIIESDLVQEVGFTPSHFEAKRHLLFLKETKLDNQEHDLTHQLHEIKNQLSTLFFQLSQRLKVKVA